MERKKLYDTEKIRNMEAELEQKLKGASHRTRMDTEQRMADNRKWEDTQLVSSGVFRMAGV